MHTVRSYFSTTVAFLVIAIGWWAADAVVCCNSSSVMSGSGDVVAPCQNKNRTFHAVEAFGDDGMCDDNRTAGSVRKCCPRDQSYDTILELCRPAGVDGGKWDPWRLWWLLREKHLLLNTYGMVGYNYEQPLCDDGDVLVTVNTTDLENLIKPYKFKHELPPGYCFELTSSDNLVALTCHVTAVACCNSNSVAKKGDEEVVASCQNKNRMFHMVEALGRGTCDDNRTAVSIRKCCPWGQYLYWGTCYLHVRKAYPYRFFKLFFNPGWMIQQLMQLLRRRARAVANEVMVGYNYEELLCGDPSEIVDIDASDIMLMKNKPSKFPEERCFDLSSYGVPMGKVCRLRHDCSKNTCVRRCCKDERLIVDGPNAPECSQNKNPFTMSAYEMDEDGRQVGRSNKTVLPYYLEFKCSHRDKLEYGFQLTEDGDLYLTYEHHTVPPTKYCVGYSQGIVIDTLVAYICDADTVFMVERARASSILIFFRASYAVSAVCLALTLLVYNTLSSFRNIRNYYVKCYLQQYFVLCIWVVYQMSMETEKKKEKCLLFGYITLFVFLSTLCWLNVICFDIYRMIRYNISRNINTSSSVRTVMYHFYCLALPSIFVCTGIYLLISHDESLQGLANIFEVTGYGCFYNHTSDYEGLFSIVLPVFVMLVANLFFFLLTTIHLSRMKLELNKCNLTDSKTKSFLVYKEKFVMSIKLFLIIGIPYFLTVLSIILRMEGTKWNIIYATSSLQGVFIFIIFVAKHQVIMDLRNKFKGSMDHSEPIQMNNIPGS